MAKIERRSPDEIAARKRNILSALEKSGLSPTAIRVAAGALNNITFYNAREKRAEISWNDLIACCFVYTDFSLVIRIYHDGRISAEIRNRCGYAADVLSVFLLPVWTIIRATVSEPEYVKVPSRVQVSQTN